MIKLLGALALSAISFSALAGEIKTKHNVVVKIDGNLQCLRQDLNTGYIPTVQEHASLNISESDLHKIVLLKHNSLRTRSRVLDLCQKLAELPLIDGSVTGQLDIIVSTDDVQNAGEAKQYMSETLRLTLPNGVVLNSSAYAVIK